MTRTLRTAAVALVTTAAVVAGPSLAAQAHDGKGKGTKEAKGARPEGTRPEGARPERGKGRGPGKALTGLVAAGTLTQAQADAVVAAFVADHEAKRAANQQPTRPANEAEARSRLSAVLAPLVTKGTITQAQADAVVNAIVAEHAARVAAGEGR